MRSNCQIRWTDIGEGFSTSIYEMDDSDPEVLSLGSLLTTVGPCKTEEEVAKLVEEYLNGFSDDVSPDSSGE